jgi:hypothetical protein
LIFSGAQIQSLGETNSSAAKAFSALFERGIETITIKHRANPIPAIATIFITNMRNKARRGHGRIQRRMRTCTSSPDASDRQAQMLI